MQTESTKRETKIFRWLAWVLLGAVLVYIVSAVSLTGDYSISGPFYNCGAVSDVNNSQFRREVAQETGYQDASGTVVLEQGTFDYLVSAAGYTEAWHYLCVRVDDLTAESIHWQISYEEVEDDTVIEEMVKDYDLSEGMNLLDLPEQKFSRMRISISGDSGCSFCIGSMQFRENPPVFSGAGIAVAALVTGLCYLALSGIVITLYRRRKGAFHRRIYVCIDMLQECYLVLLRRLVIIREKVPALYRKKRLLRTVLFLGMFCYNLYVCIAGTYTSGFRRHIVVYLIILLAIALLSLEEKVSKKNWNNPLVWSWLILAVMACVSNFLVLKQRASNKFYGYILLLLIGLFIFVWNNMKDRGDLLEDFVWATHVFFWIMAAYCILLCPETGGARYSGFTTNPSIFALYLVTCWAVVLGGLEHVLRSRGKKRILCFYAVEGCAVFTFIWKSQSMGPLFCVALLTVIWLVRMIVCSFRLKIKKALLGTILCALCLLLPVYAGMTFALNHGPVASKTETAQAEDTENPDSDRLFLGTVVYASEREGLLRDSRVGTKLRSTSLSSLLSGRNYYYRLYLRNMNLLGHTSRPSMWGARRLPHNAILGTAYFYGIFTAVPYVLMLVAVLVRAWKFGRKNIRFAAVPFFVCLSSIVTSMTDNVEQTFGWLSWIGLYLLMGCVFCEDDLSEQGAVLSEDAGRDRLRGRDGDGRHRAGADPDRRGVPSGQVPGGARHEDHDGQRERLPL